MNARWSPGDDELDLVARSAPPPAPSSSQAEQMRTRLLAAQPSTAQQRPRRAWPLVATFGAALAAAAAILVWISVRPAHQMPKLMIAAAGSTQYETVSSWPDQVLRLDSGRLDIALEPLGPGERFRVRSGGDELEVRGTEFFVVASHAQITSVVVERGLVELRRPNEPAVIIGAGEQWDRVQTAGAAPARPPATTADSTVAAAANPVAAPQNPVSATDTGSTSRVTQRTSPSASNVKANAGSPGTLTATSPPGSPAVAASKSPPATPQIAVSAALPPPLPATAKPGEAEFRTGWAALRAGKSDDAARSFSASCGAAQNEAFGEDACFWTGVAAKRAGQTKLAREALTRFLAKFPSSGRAAEASALLGWELYDAGDLDGAERLFKRAVTDRVPKVRDSATRGLTAIDRRRTSP